MKVSFIINIIWSLVMVIAFASLLFGEYSHAKAILFGLGLVYFALAILAFRGNRWAIILSVLTAFLLMLRWLPMVLVNAWMFKTGHPLYLDSPGTILIVISYTVVFAVPATLLSILYSFQYKKLLKLFRKQEGQ